MAKPLQRDWTDARAKVDREGRCRTCKSPKTLEAAHIIGRHADLRVGVKRYVHPDSIIPLCGRCHRLYDGHALEVLGVLTLDEQIQAVEDAGGLELARIRTAPLAYERSAA